MRVWRPDAHPEFVLCARGERWTSSNQQTDTMTIPILTKLSEDSEYQSRICESYRYIEQVTQITLPSGDQSWC